MSWPSFGTQALAIDNTNLYWLNCGTYTLHQGEIMACAKTGCGDRPTVLATNIQGPIQLVTDEIDVYWAEQGVSSASPSPGTGLIRKCNVGGCNDAPTTIASGLGTPLAVAVDGDYVYWTDSGGRNDGNYGRIWRAPK